MSSSMLSKIDPKLVAAVTLILGLIVGYYVDSSLISGPLINDLTSQTVAQQEQINDFETQLGSLENEKNSLQTQYEELETSTQQTIEEIEEQDLLIVNLENQIQSGLDLIDDQQVTIVELEEQISDLDDDYSDLLDTYNEIYNPLYSEFTTDELEIRFTVNNDVYSDNTPILGTVEIEYSDGTAFRGTFKLNLYKVFIAAGSLSDAFEIRGATAYNLKNPFLLGPGSYKLTLSDIRDNQGELLVSNSELKDYPIYVFMG